MKLLVPALASALLFASAARADILFFDINDAPQEIAAAKKAAALRHEKLVIIPDRSTPEKQQALLKIRDVETQQQRIMQPLVAIWQGLDADRKVLIREKSKEHPDQDKVNKLQDKVDRENSDFEAKGLGLQPQLLQLQQQISSIQNLPTFNQAELDELLKKFHDQHKKISSIIVSGHNGSGTFTGNLGTVSSEQIRNSFKKYEDLYEGVRSVYGWGCYSATHAGAQIWFDAFPHLAFMGGFDAGAPSQERTADHQYLTGLLLKEAELIRTTDIKNMNQQARVFGREVKAIPGFNLTNAAACTRSVCVGVNTGTLTQKDIANSCGQQALDLVGTNSERFNQVMNGYASQPCDTQHSWLRDYYNFLREHQHCADVAGPNQMTWAVLKPQADSAVKMIFWDQVRSNLFKYYQDDFKKMKDVLPKYEVSLPDPSLPLLCDSKPDDGKSVTQSSLRNFQTQICNLANWTAQEADTMLLARCCARLDMFTQLKCVPFTWVEPPRPGGKLDAPDCDPTIDNPTIENAEVRLQQAEDARKAAAAATQNPNQPVITGPGHLGNPPNLPADGGIAGGYPGAAPANPAMGGGLVGAPPAQPGPYGGAGMGGGMGGGYPGVAPVPAPSSTD